MRLPPQTLHPCHWLPCLLACVLAGGVAAAPLPAADLLIRGGTVYRGDEAPAQTGDVVVRGERIVEVGPDAGTRYRAARTIEARGLIVAPGFIDAHAHPDSYIRADARSVRANAPWAYQGVTTLLIGVDGYGSPDIAAEAEHYAKAGVGTNLVPYVGFGAVRTRVLGMEARAPTAAELDRMRTLVARGMCEGAVGFSTGLFYAPQSYAQTDEVVALAREAAIRGGIYDTHQRDESSYTIGLVASVRETIDIGARAGLPVHFAHIKALGVDVQGKAQEVIDLIDAARARGIEVTADQYPWDASGSALEPSLLPGWAQAGGRTALIQRLDDPPTLARIRAEMTENLRRRGGAASLLLTSAGRPWTGRTLEAVAAQWRLDPLDAALDIIRRDPRGTEVASFNMREDDIRRFMREPWVVTSSDGSDGHPRQYATFPRKYAKYVLEDQVITLGEFIRSSTGRTADLYKLDGRGYLKAGNYADVVVFDPARYRWRADYVHPRRLSQGVVALLVNGRMLLSHGRLTAELPGRVLLHTPPKGSCP